MTQNTLKLGVAVFAALGSLLLAVRPGEARMIVDPIRCAPMRPCVCTSANLRKGLANPPYCVPTTMVKPQF